MRIPSYFRSFLRPGIIIPLVIAVLLIGFRAALPTIVSHYLNRLLADMPGHTGIIEDVDLSIWRGAYSVQGLRVNKIDEKKGKLTPLFNAREIDLSVDWSALFHRQLVAKMEFIDPKLNLESEPKKEEIEKQKFRIEDLIRRIRNFVPFNVSRLTIVNGEIHFRDISANPPIDLYFDSIELIARNLTNSEKVSDSLWATVSGTARSRGNGRVKLEMRLNPYEKQPTYQLAFELNNLRLPEINDYLKHYLAVEARDGRFSLYAESTAKEGRFRGYAKPFVKDLDILYVKNNTKSATEAIKGFFVKIIAKVFENKAQEQLATRVDFTGTFKSPEVGVWDAVIGFIRNAFVEALKPSFDKSVAPVQAGKAENGKSEKKGKF